MYDHHLWRDGTNTLIFSNRAMVAFNILFSLLNLLLWLGKFHSCFLLLAYLIWYKDPLSYMYSKNPLPSQKHLWIFIHHITMQIYVVTHLSLSMLLIVSPSEDNFFGQNTLNTLIGINAFKTLSPYSCQLSFSMPISLLQFTVLVVLSIFFTLCKDYSTLLDSYSLMSFILGCLSSPKERREHHLFCKSIR
jgi:hypothetical protein